MEIGVYAAKARFSELIRRAQAGEEIVVVDERAGGLPLVRIITATPPTNEETA